LEEDFRSILNSESSATHRLLTVFDALTAGKPIPSLRALLRSIALDSGRPEWQRCRAIEAYLNGTKNSSTERRELFDALANENPSEARAALRVQLAAHLPNEFLSAADIKSVIADHQRDTDASLVGGLSGLRRRR
jgi:hypothetical protein